MKRESDRKASSATTRYAKQLTLLATACLALTLSAQTKIHKTPEGWSDDMSEVLQRSKKENKSIFVFFPLHYDTVMSGNKKFSLIKSWTGPSATATLARKYILAFYPYGHPVPSDWKRTYEYTHGCTMALLILDSDGNLIWKMFGSGGLWGEQSGDDFAWLVEPKLSEALEKIVPARKKADRAASEKIWAQIMFEALKAYENQFVRDWFRDDAEKMVAADKDGDLGIREHYPYFWLVVPLVKTRTDFWNARESKIGRLLDKDRSLKRKAAAISATRDLRQEWEPKFQKFMKVAELVEKKVSGTDLHQVQWLQKEVKEHLDFWNGKTNSIPYPDI